MQLAIHKRASHWGKIQPPLGTPVDWGNPITKGLIMASAFNQGGGLKFRDSANNRNYSSTNVTPDTWTVGPHGKAIGLDLNGYEFLNVGSYVPFDDLGAFTIAVWAKFHSAGQFGLGFVMTKVDINGLNGWFLQTEAGRINFIRDWTTTNAGILTNAPVTFGKWLMLVATTDGGSLASGFHVYEDGVEFGTSATSDGTGTLLSDAANDLIIGNFPTASRTADADFGAAYLWNRELSLAEVRSLTNQPYLPFRQPTIDAGPVVSSGVTIPVFIHHFQSQRQA